MQNWVILIFLYSIFKGLFECSKKKAVEKNSIYVVLACFSSIAFLMVAFTSKNVFDIQLKYLLIILVKSIIIVIAWILSLYAIKRMPVSLYEVINVSRVIFSIILGMIFLGERLTILTILGIIIVISGLVLMNRISNENEEKKTSLKVIVALLVCCMLSAVTALIDKIVLVDITIDQLQFWFLLFLVIIYWLILMIKKQEINIKNITKNYWIPITAICLFVGDRLLFMANAIPESKLSIMSVLKQVSTIEVIILGKILFKEKNTIRKLLCSILVILGIILTLV